MHTPTHLRSGLVTLAAVLASTTPTFAQEASWPQWRGPDRTGISAESDWSSEGKPAPKWTKQLGLGHSSFSIAGGHVFTLGYDAEQGLDSVFCLDIESGEEVWSHSYPCEIWDVAHDGGALTTPTIVGDVVYTSNREGKVFCFERASGEIRWQRDLRADMELEPPTWGFSASPLVVEGLVFLNIDRVVALDAATGEEAWVSEEPYGKAYSTPAPFELEGRNYLAVLSGSGLRVLDRDYGEMIAFHPWSKDPEIFPMTPVVIDDRIFISAGYDRGAAMLRFDGEGLTELWASRVMRNKMSGAVLWKDHLFGFDESILKCVSLDGKEVWRKRGMGTGSMSIAGERMVILTGRGEVVVAEANPEEYVELSRRSVLEGGTAWSTPVLADGLIFCRSSLGEMAVLDHRSTAGEVSATAKAESAELPAAEDILARHVEAVRGARSAQSVRAVHMSGASKSLINTVREGQVELAWDADAGFSWRDDVGIEFGHDAIAGWMIKPNSAPALFDPEPLSALRQGANLSSLFDPRRGVTSMETVGRTVFEGADCYVVRTEYGEGQPRTLHFAVESGLLMGHQSEGSFLWTLDRYQEIEGVMLPTLWTLYEDDKGESFAADFQTVQVNPEAEAAWFEVPDSIRPFMRSPEEVAADTVRLTKLHAKILGEWHAESDPEGEAATFEVKNGFLTWSSPERDPATLSEPDEDGVMSLVSAPYVTFTPELDEAEDVVAIVIAVGGQQRERLLR